MNLKSECHGYLVLDLAFDINKVKNCDNIEELKDDTLVSLSCSISTFSRKNEILCFLGFLNYKLLIPQC